MAIVSVLMLGIGSALMLAARAVPAEESVFRHNADASVVVQQMVTELHTATSIWQLSPVKIEFTVHDRDNDGDVEVILYQWSGTAGSPLRRSYNGGTAVVIAENVHAFALVCTTKNEGVNELVEQVNITLQLGTDASAKVRTAVQLLNRPDIGLL
jgi:hypothetical protein